jgi:hypothetical protein
MPRCIGRASARPEKPDEITRPVFSAQPGMGFGTTRDGLQPIPGCRIIGWPALHRTGFSPSGKAGRNHEARFLRTTRDGLWYDQGWALAHPWLQDHRMASVPSDGLQPVRRSRTKSRGPLSPYNQGWAFVRLGMGFSPSLVAGSPDTPALHRTGRLANRPPDAHRRLAARPTIR